MTTALTGVKRGSFTALVEAMMRPEFYPNHPESVELRQTHLSCAFLAGEYVYKIKRPVHFAFVDCSTLEKRHRLCIDEVRLNRRLAPEVYVGVVPIVGRNGEFTTSAGSDGGTVEEYAVQMIRLPESSMLDRMLAAGDVNNELVRTIAQRLAAFHSECGTGKAWDYGCASAVWRLLWGNLEELAAFRGKTVSDGAHDELQEYIRRSVDLRWGLLNDRARAGRVRDGHGDLRCEHVCVRNGSVAIIDCLEFNESLRYGDVALDIAFLAMDLDFRNAHELSDEFVAAYRDASGDGDLALLMPLYKCHRALVRAKVQSIKSDQPEVPPAQRRHAMDSARRFLELAIQYARNSSPALVVVCGISGSGKSTLAHRLAARLGFEVLSSDAIRKGIAGVSPSVRSAAEYGEGIYGEDFTRRTYAQLTSQAHERLMAGAGVILDATFKSSSHRAQARDAAARAGVPVLFVECRLDPAETMRRLAERARKSGEISDADAAVYLRQRDEFAALDEIADRNRLVADTSKGVGSELRGIEARLAALRHSTDGR